MNRRPGPGTRWALIGAGVVGYELYTIYNETDGDTLSEVVRAVVPVETRSGRIAWAIIWWLWGLGWTYWFWRHIEDEHSVPCLDKRRRR